jgi:hypothetical protein
VVREFGGLPTAKDAEGRGRALNDFELVAVNDLERNVTFCMEVDV